MATLDINGQHVDVDDSFLKLSPADQQSTVDHIAATLSPKAAPALSTSQYVGNLADQGIDGMPIIGPLLRKGSAAIDAASSGIARTIGMDDNDLFSQAPDFATRYAENLSGDHKKTEQFAADNPKASLAAKVGGGAAVMVPATMLAPGLLGATGTFAARTGIGAASNALIGGSDAALRGSDPIAGSVVDGLLGAAAPTVQAAVSPFISRLMASVNPTGFAQRQVARAISESGQAPADIANAVRQAAREGQSQFTLADSLGNPGQRMLSTVARAPGEGRTNVVNALDQRQAGQGRRISSALAEAFDSPETAAQTESRLTAARGANADADFGAVRNDAGQVNLVDPLNHIDDVIGTARGQQLTPANDSIEGILTGYRERLARVNPDDFEAVQRIRSDMADAAQNAAQNGYGNRSRLIRGAVRRLDAAMENASQGFQQANQNFAAASRDIDAIGAGRDAFSRGRTETTIPAFNALRPEAQAAFRAGYVDPAIAQTQGAAFGVNKARPLLNDAFADEAAAMAPGNDLLQRQLNREQTMFTTRNQALGGSKTADNLADHEALGIEPTTIMHLAHGNWGGAIGSLLHAGVRGLTGNTPAVRKAVADILLQNGTTLNATALNQMVSRTIRQLQSVQTLMRSGVGAAATTANAKQTNQSPPIFVTR